MSMEGEEKKKRKREVFTRKFDVSYSMTLCSHSRRLKGWTATGREPFGEAATHIGSGAAVCGGGSRRERAPLGSDCAG